MIKEFKNQDLEILLSTMNRNTLDFLVPMFPFCHFSNFSILIINQTQKNKLLVSDFPSVRVINSFEKGLSRSRNLALKNAIGKIVLITDDDEIFKEGFDTLMVNSYNDFPKALVISFQVENSEGNLFRKYSKKTKCTPNMLNLFNVFSSEISINKIIYDAQQVEFDTDFGLGGKFSMGEEAIFLMDLKSRKQQIVFEPKVLAINPTITTTDKLDFSERYYIQGAFLTRVAKANYFLGLAKKIFFDLKQKKLRWNQILIAIKNANQGKKDYYKLKNKCNA